MTALKIKLILLFLAAFLIVVWCALVVVVYVRAQTGNIVFLQPASGTTVSNCGTAPSTAALCGVSTGWFQSVGGSWVAISSQPASGVTSVTVCNAAGGTCKSPQTGAVQVNVPIAATTTLQ